MRELVRTHRIFILLLLSTVLAGCGGMGRYDVRITLAESYRDAGNNLMPSVDVCVRGVRTLQECEDLSTACTADYTQPKVFRFGQTYPTEQLIPRTDDIWDSWQQAEVKYLLITANLPAGDGTYEKDVRRKLGLPLRTKCWKSYPDGKWVLPVRMEKPAGLVCRRPYDMSKAE